MVAGYTIDYGTDATNLSGTLDAGSNCYATVSGLASGANYYFEIAAYDTNGDVSAPSSEISYATAGATNESALVQLVARPPGTGVASGGGTFTNGTSILVTAVASNGYAFSNWSVNNVQVSTQSNYSFTVSSNVTLVARFSPIPVFYTVSVLSGPAAGGNVNGGGLFAGGSVVSVTATANSGYTFSNWTDNGVVMSTSSNYSFALASNCNLVANFAANAVTYTVGVQSNPSGAGTVDGGGAFAEGTSVTVMAAANTGYTFVSWSDGITVMSTSPKYTFTLVSNCNLVANFAGTPVDYTVTVSSNPTNAGTITGGGIFAASSSVTVAANANSGYVFSNWTQNGNVLSTATKYSFALAANCALVANFVHASVSGDLGTNSTFTVTPSAGSNGVISPSAPQSAVQGTNIVFSAVPADNYEVRQWLTNGVLAQTGGGLFTLVNVETNETVEVTFTNIPPVNTNFTLVVSGNGTVSPKPGSTQFRTGGKYALTATAGKGSLFAGWVSNGIVVSMTPRYTCIVLTNLALQAVFVTNPFTPLVGVYRGLFYDTNGAAEDSSGAFTATVSGSGAYSARLTGGAGNYAFSGQFSLESNALKTIPRTGLTSITVQLQLGSSNQPMTGTVSDGSWTAELVAVPVAFSRTNPTPLAGKYTMVIPGNTNTSVEPNGNGFGAVTVSKLGAVTFAGTLGDGTAASAASIVSGEGTWPFYVPLYGGKGFILGWLNFTNVGTIGGQTGWFKLAQPTAKFYPDGFTTAAQVAGSTYQYTNGLPQLGFSTGLLSLESGGLSDVITNSVALGLTFHVTGSNSVNMTFNNSSGLFKTSVTDPSTGKPVVVKGVVLQNQDYGAGLFVNQNETGNALLTPAP